LICGYHERVAAERQRQVCGELVAGHHEIAARAQTYGSDDRIGERGERMKGGDALMRRQHIEP
jgi:hypothetical protein